MQSLTQLTAIFSTLFFLACQPVQSQTDLPAELPKEFGAYWYQGKAELSSYALKQARYGEIHEGEAVLIYVTEDFSRKKQVKLDNPGQAGNDKVPIMKLNASRKFLTGLYPYSILQSVFSPTNLRKDPHALKTSTTVQEWCGHVYNQLNREKNGYRFTNFSYFESEGDTEATLPLTWLEDELWTWIRIAPDHLPTGKQKLIPSSVHTRLVHKSMEPREAELSLATEGGVSTYQIVYPADQRTVSIRFEAAFPHKILGWEEEQTSWGRTLTTTAELKETIQTDYWNRHNNADRS
ncbi:MAG: hypothetical protein AAF399_20075, partial [Bacteroidota bacterium]